MFLLSCSKTIVEHDLQAEIFQDIQDNTIEIPEQRHNVTLPKIGQFEQMSELEKLYKELLEELRKRIKFGSFSNGLFNRGDFTSWASAINNRIGNTYDDTPMTLSAELQRLLAKSNPIANRYPEQEYYKISLNLDKIRNTGKIPNWMQKHNDIKTLGQFGNKELAENIKKKIIKTAKINNDTKTINNLNDVFVITAKPNSDLTNLIINNPNFKREIENRLSDIKSGKYEHSSFSYIFKDKDGASKDEYKEFSTNHTISKCDICNIKLEKDGYITATIIDYYDFSEGGGNINDNAYKQQQNGKLENYALVVPIKMQINKK